MAKAGFWLRGAKGKLSGASIGKGSNGGTVIREIVTPKNPKTEKQMYQRAIMATVMRAYSSGKEILNHSFQGKAVGVENQRRFISLNSRLLREQLAQDLNAIKLGTTPYVPVARVVSQGAVTSTPFQMQVSEGTYPQNFFTFNTGEGEDAPGRGFQAKAVEENETPAAYAARVNLIEGDIYTFVVFAPHQNEIVYQGKSGEPTDILYNTEFLFVRFIVKSNLATEGALNTIGQLFDIQKSSNVTPAFNTLPVNTILTPASLTGADDMGGIACIRSREDEDLRSTSALQLFVEDGDWGLAAPYILPAWPSTEQVGNSELILEGGNF